MSNTLSLFEQLNFLNILWLFFIAFAIHELEEWNIIQFERRNFTGVPAEATEKSDRLFIAFFIAVGFVWCSIATLPGDPTIAAYVILPFIFILLTNSLQHVYWTFYFKQYAPGLSTAVLLLLPICCYVLFRAVQQEYVSIWYAVACTTLLVLPLAQTIRSGKQMTPYVRTVHRIGAWWSERLTRQV